VTDKPLGEAILHGSEGRRMTADVLRGVFRRRIEWSVFEEHFTMTQPYRVKRGFQIISLSLWSTPLYSAHPLGRALFQGRSGIKTLSL